MTGLRRPLRTPFRHLLAIVFCALLAGPAPAADNEYRIELLVFRNVDAHGDGELFARALADALDSAADARDVRWLGSDAYQLAGIAGSMKRSGRYKPLLHVAWQERVAGRSSARAVALPLNGAGGGEYVTGTARVGLGRYLHLDLDLELHEPARHDVAGGDAYYGDPPDYRLQESRRMRSKEIHYFDHPLFGALAIITPVE